MDVLGSIEEHGLNHCGHHGYLCKTVLLKHLPSVFFFLSYSILGVCISVSAPVGIKSYTEWKTGWL